MKTVHLHLTACVVRLPSAARPSAGPLVKALTGSRPAARAARRPGAGTPPPPWRQGDQSAPWSSRPRAPAPVQGRHRYEIAPRALSGCLAGRRASRRHAERTYGARPRQTAPGGRVRRGRARTSCRRPGRRFAGPVGPSAARRPPPPSWPPRAGAPRAARSSRARAPRRRPRRTPPPRRHTPRGLTCRRTSPRPAGCRGRTRPRCCRSRAACRRAPTTSRRSRRASRPSCWRCRSAAAPPRRASRRPSGGG
jgi:hypothetical protein